MVPTIKPRIIYFVIFIVFVSQGRFSALLFQDEFGFTDFQIGVIFGASIISGQFCTPFFTKRADLISHTLVLKELLFIHCCFASVLAFAPLIGEPSGRFVFVLIVRFCSSGIMAPISGKYICCCFLYY